MLLEIDLVVLTREPGALRADVEAGIREQTGVRLTVHRVVGTPQPGDASRWETIARARNRGKVLGSAPWLMFLDDDVVLERDCVSTLVRELRDREAYGALASNYLGESCTSDSEPRHVGMGATLFRRSALDRIQFRWTADRCECQCCCDDLRRLLLGITYLPAARSRHLGAVGQSPVRPEPAAQARDRGNQPRHPSAIGPPSLESAEQARNCGNMHASGPLLALRARRHASANGPTSPAATGPGHVLAAFDKHHCGLFIDQFLASLRAAGNGERVIVVGYGLTLDQQQRLARQGGVQCLLRPGNRIHAAIRRLHDFQDAARSLPEGAPTAYWDAGDCIFQSRLDPLWKLIASNPGRLLGCGEPTRYPENGAIVKWTRTIRDESSRARAFELFSTNEWVNAGFVAGTAGVLARYFEAAARIRAEVLAGTTDFGDQTAFNYYLHSQPEAWRQIESGWNYCLCSRPRGTYHVRPDGLFEASNGEPIHVVHGNARTLWAVPGLARVRRRLNRTLARRVDAPRLTYASL